MYEQNKILLKQAGEEEETEEDEEDETSED